MIKIICDVCYNEVKDNTFTPSTKEVDICSKECLEEYHKSEGYKRYLLLKKERNKKR